jgi:hypothetical protein
MKVTLEAVVGFVTRSAEKEKEKEKTPGAAVAQKVPAASRALVPRKAVEMTANDRRFLRSLRIAADDAKVEESPSS